MIRLTEAGASRSDDPARLLLARPLAFWAVVLALLVVPVMATVTATAGCGAELREVDGQCVGLGALGKMAPHPLVAPVARRIEEQNAAIPLGHKVFTIAYLGPLTTQPGAQFKDGQMTAVAGELAGIGAYDRRSAFLFRLAVVNSLQMKATVHWLETLGLAEGVGRKPKVAVVWQRQDGELYSQDLKDLFLAESMSFVSLTDVRDTSLTNQSQQTLWRWIAESGVGVSFAHAAFGFDAAQAVAIAFSAYRTQSEADDILSGVHYNLRGQAFDGATGKVSFSEHATDHDAQGREVWLMTVESGRPIQATWVCRPTATAAECASPSE
ncbi:hypothetical protein [Nonomuraea harbinensis]|uniref:Leucine-binding protein domain-containing protein n=1 Tax=Nonomuraea harbinensis TaxID=1286938 RepID=A0ABW1C4K0_9ACTN